MSRHRLDPHLLLAIGASLVVFVAGVSKLSLNRAITSGGVRGGTLLKGGQRLRRSTTDLFALEEEWIEAKGDSTFSEYMENHG